MAGSWVYSLGALFLDRIREDAESCHVFDNLEPAGIAARCGGDVTGQSIHAVIYRFNRVELRWRHHQAVFRLFLCAHHVFLIRRGER